MIKNSSKAAHRPDSLAGIVAAFEGIRDSYTMLNSPIGCKYPLGYTSNSLASHVAPVETDSFADFYFGQSRLPCTYTDEQDFVYGTEEKITRALQVLDSKRYGLIGVINQIGRASCRERVFRAV
jgi:nitrogenase molybdenum-iron protein alpha/beta subunit